MNKQIRNERIVADLSSPDFIVKQWQNIIGDEIYYSCDCRVCNERYSTNNRKDASECVACARARLHKPLNAHYKHGSIDPCQYVEAMGDAEYRGACILNILKYITRYPHKGTPMEDLMKAQDYVNMLIEHQKKKESKP